MSDLLFVNAYEVTRHYGGREEGGWWYNRQDPLASIPVLAKREIGHPSYCWTCEKARMGEGEFCKIEIYNEEGNLIETPETDLFNKESLIIEHLVPEDPEQVNMFIQHLTKCFNDINDGNIYSVNGGSELSIIVENSVAAASPQNRPRYE